LADQSNLFGRGNSRIVAAGYRCTGSQQQLSSCSLRTYVPLSSGTNYQTRLIAGIICQGDTSRPTECKHGDVRLVGGQTEMEGRVEFCSYGYWAIACDTYWGREETTAVCKQLGFPVDGENAGYAIDRPVAV
jgi:deleted-in-malignant-brain-tumors protein 1